ncbi:TspO/MBR family protein [Nocardioides acrostichi]|uniref:Tryptophan-rich sensory protein n=1 Tax=Nocardioides acrostichi TaxID=2784339 RepID=A0A930V063_9ACTN|nr:TspO/MBR family protein [Nocardioides acrostichi]MBF4163271.1 tryptophan-rich sensory protein [Nocardioides acrostichi]
MTTSPATPVRSGPSRDLLALGGFGLAVTVAAGAGGLAAANAGAQYDRLEQPPFAPPSWLFGPVWSVLYVLVAVSGWLAWRSAGRVEAATWWWMAQIVLNACWTPLFFAADRYGLALVEIVVLLGAVAGTTVVATRRRRLAGLLLAPYLAWVGFATLLNASIWWLNRA